MIYFVVMLVIIILVCVVDFSYFFSDERHSSIMYADEDYVLAEFKVSEELKESEDPIGSYSQDAFNPEKDVSNSSNTPIDIDALTKEILEEVRYGNQT